MVNLKISLFTMELAHPLLSPPRGGASHSLGTADIHNNIY